MLLNLIKKDFIVCRAYVWFAALYGLAITIFMPFSFGPVLMSTGMNYLLLSTIHQMDDRCKGSALLGTLPYSRKQIVFARYCTSMVLFAACIAFYTVIMLIASQFSNSFKEIGIFTVEGTLLAFAVSCLFSAIFIPLNYRLGSEKARYINMIGFIGLFVLNMSSSEIFGSAGVDINVYVLASVAAAILAVSYFVSVVIYSKKDF
ncbi:MAG: hypothetical protein BWY11_02490 [Firmicutes bacterium ADurb.Bin182]|nr:MAG: hypothetical protein BWY11_02490 [Firmicutes bacterium ADurb.Bin182]